MRRHWGLMLLCLLTTVPLLGMVVGLSQLLGGGRNFTGLNLCFPYASLVAELFPYGPWAALAWVSLFAQLPAYAAILGRASGRSRVLSRVLLLLLIHALAACACFLVERRDENRLRENISEESSARALRASGAPPNNGMHPTADTTILMLRGRHGAAGDAGR